MKILTVLGTRPEIIRLSRIIPTLDELADHVVLHTGQNADYRLSELFFEELELRAPDHRLECAAPTPMAQIANILTGCERVMAAEAPDRLLVLGDTNSALAAFVGKRLGIPVFHMEAGNRCFDDRVPEEVNRRLVDHCSDVLLAYTEGSRRNLLREGIEAARVVVSGNPIAEVLAFYAEPIEASGVLDEMGLESDGYLLATIHRAESVDVPERLGKLMRALAELHRAFRLPVVYSLHPRTRSRLAASGIDASGDGVRAFEPKGLFDFVKLEKNARCVLTDSGTVQEECCVLGTPTVTLREVTERPETVAAGGNLIAGVEPAAVVACAEAALALPRPFSPPPEYLREDVSAVAAAVVLDSERAGGGRG